MTPPELSDAVESSTPALLLTVSVAAERLSISKRTLYRLMEDGEIAYVTIGAKRLVEPAELDRFVGALKDAS